MVYVPRKGQYSEPLSPATIRGESFRFAGLASGTLPLSLCAPGRPLLRTPIRQSHALVRFGQFSPAQASRESRAIQQHLDLKFARSIGRRTFGPARSSHQAQCTRKEQRTRKHALRSRTETCQKAAANQAQDLYPERGSPKACDASRGCFYGTRTESWLMICGSYENTSRLAGSTLTLSQFTSPRVGWWSPKVSTRVKLVTRFPALSSSGLSMRK